MSRLTGHRTDLLGYEIIALTEECKHLTQTEVENTLRNKLAQYEDICDSPEKLAEVWEKRQGITPGLEGGRQEDDINKVIEQLEKYRELTRRHSKHQDVDDWAYTNRLLAINACIDIVEKCKKMMTKEQATKKNLPELEF